MCSAGGNVKGGGSDRLKARESMVYKNECSGYVMRSRRGRGRCSVVEAYRSRRSDAK